MVASIQAARLSCGVSPSTRKRTSKLSRSSCWQHARSWSGTSRSTCHSLYTSESYALPVGFTLSSNVILDCARRCENLRELRCVNCHVEPILLFCLLSLKLTRVTKLEWTLYEEIFYKSRLDRYAVALIEDFDKLEGPQLITMYVEQTRSPVVDSLLDCFLMRCPRLRHLHIHGIQMEHLPGATR
ncbi:hypothetical protein MTO96_023020 [Rhipicephalus appendiculatus]